MQILPSYQTQGLSLHYLQDLLTVLAAEITCISWHFFSLQSPATDAIMLHEIEFLMQGDNW